MKVSRVIPRMLAATALLTAADVAVAADPISFAANSGTARAQAYATPTGGIAPADTAFAGVTSASPWQPPAAELPADPNSTATTVPAESESYEELRARLLRTEDRLLQLERTAGFGAASATRSFPATQYVLQDESADEKDPNDITGDPIPDTAESELQKRLSELEESEQTFQSFIDAAKEAKEEAKKKPTFEAGGRIHLDAWAFPHATEGIGYFEHPNPSDDNYGTDPEDRFLFRRTRLELQGEVPDLMFWRMQIDFATPENPAMKDVYLGWRLPDNHELIAGHQKRPIGLDALDSSRFTIFLERPLVVEAFNRDARRLGLQMYAFSEDLTYNWRYGVFNVEDIQQTGIYRGDSLQLGAYGRLAATPWYDETSGGRGYLHLGIAGSVVRPDGDASDADSNVNEARFRSRPEGRSDNSWADTGPIAGASAFEQLGLESVLTIGALQFTGEYLFTAVQRDEVTAGTGPDVLLHGGYIQAAYFLTGEFHPWDRESGQLGRVKPLENFFLVERCTGGCGRGWGAWEVAARYDYLDLSDADILGGRENNVTLALNWHWNAYARLQFNVVQGHITDHEPVGGYTSGDFLLAGTRLAIDF